jgi:hypothetical protein
MSLPNIEICENRATPRRDDSQCLDAGATLARKACRSVAEPNAGTGAWPGRSHVNHVSLLGDVGPLVSFRGVEALVDRAAELVRMGWVQDAAVIAG